MGRARSRVAIILLPLGALQVWPELPELIPGGPGKPVCHLDQVLSPSCLLVRNVAMPVAEVAPLRRSTSLCGEHNGGQLMRLRPADTASTRWTYISISGLRASARLACTGMSVRTATSPAAAEVLADAWSVDLPCHDPVDRWFRDRPAGRRPGPVGRRQHRDSRGNPDKQALPRVLPMSSCHRTVWGPSELFPRARPLFPPYRQGAYVPSQPSLQHGPFFGGLSAHHVGYTCEASSMTDPEPRLGLISKVSTQHLSGGSPPYSPGHPGEPRRSQQRRTDRPEHTQRQHLNSQT